MRAKVLTGAVVGRDGALVEVDIAPGGHLELPRRRPGRRAGQEARERVRAAHWK